MKCAAVFVAAVEIYAVIAYMVENAVEDYLDSVPTRFSAKKDMKQPRKRWTILPKRIPNIVVNCYADEPTRRKTE